jgi:hypothetical protein
MCSWSPRRGFFLIELLENVCLAAGVACAALCVLLLKMENSSVACRVPVNIITTCTSPTTLPCTHTRRECVLFIGTRFSNLYTAVDTPAEAACFQQRTATKSTSSAHVSSRRRGRAGQGRAARRGRGRGEEPWWLLRGGSRRQRGPSCQ